jgi:hypothetical protein
MSRLIRIFSGRHAAAVIAAVALTATGVADAYWSTPGSGSGSGSIAALPAPTGVSAASPGGSSTPSVSWTASKPLNGISPTGYYVRRWSGSTASVAGGTCGSLAAPIDQTSCTDSSVADGTYTYTVIAVYRSWTAESTRSAPVTVAGDVTPPVSTLTTSPASAEGSNGWFTRASVTFTLAASDSGSGVAGTFYKIDGGSQQSYSGKVTISTQGDHTVTYWSVDKAGNEESHDASHVKLDNVTPATTIAPNPSSPDGSNGWYTTAPTFTLGASDASAGVASTDYQIDSGSVQTYTSSPVSIPDGQHAVSYWSVDSAGNTEAAHTTATIKVDATKPGDALSLGASPSHALLSGSTLYFGGALGGSFKLIDTVSDAGSGAASATFPALSATSWTTHTAETISTPASGPFTSSTFNWSAGASVPTAYTVSSKDKAGNTSSGATLTFVSDTTAPTGGALSVNGVAAAAGGSTSNTTGTGFAIGSRSDYVETQGAGQSGLASSTLTIQSETFTGNTCGAPGSGGAYSSPTPVTGTANPAIVTGFCYLYTLTGTDSVGNTTAIRTTVKVDTTPPSSPSVGLSAATGNTFISGTTVYINAQAAKEGSFKAIGSATDAQTGVSTITLPTPSGFSSGGGTLSSPFETTYKWSGAVGASGAQSVTATDGFGLSETNSSAFAVTPDTTAPSGGSVSAPARVHTTSVSVTFSGGSDAGSGLSAAAGEVLRAEATYTVSSDTCGSFGSFAKVGSAGPSSPFADTGVANNKCYEYEYRGFDNVGNSSTYGPSSATKVDTTAPALTGISSTNGNGLLESGDVLTLTFSEPIAASSVPATGTVTQSREGNNAAKLAITGLTGTEAWSTGQTAYEEKNTSTIFNESAAVSGATVKVTIGTNVSGAGNAKAGTSSAVTGVVSSAVTDIAGNAASATPFSITAQLW